MPSTSPRFRAIECFAALVLTITACTPDPSAPEQTDPSDPAPVQPEPNASAGTGDAVPVIASDEATFEFGTIAPSESVTHVFKLVNRGTADLHIEQVKRT